MGEGLTAEEAEQYECSQEGESGSWGTGSCTKNTIKNYKTGTLSVQCLCTSFNPATAVG